MALRGAGVSKPVVLLEGVITGEQLDEAAHHALDIVVHESEQLALLERAPASHRFVVWLKIDTGMNRLGFRADALEEIFPRLAALGPRVRELRLMTHFASADERDSPLNALQLERFARWTDGRSLSRSLANSAALFALPAARADWVRPGLALYGVSPFPELPGAELGLQPVMRLASTVIAMRDVPLGESVGYGGVWRAERDSHVAIVAAGYGDGLPRALPNGTPVLVNGHRGRLAGRVSMDMIAVDVTAMPVVQVGDPVLLWGPELPVEEVAAHAGTISYELLCAVSQRVPLTHI
jgi:alanine racemase